MSNLFSGQLRMRIRRAACSQASSITLQQRLVVKLACERKNTAGSLSSSSLCPPAAQESSRLAQSNELIRLLTSRELARTVSCETRDGTRALSFSVCNVRAATNRRKTVGPEKNPAARSAEADVVARKATVGIPRVPQGQLGFTRRPGGTIGARAHLPDDLMPA